MKKSRKPQLGEEAIDAAFLVHMKIMDDMLDDVPDSMYLFRLMEGVEEFNFIYDTQLDPYENAMDYLKKSSKKED